MGEGGSGSGGKEGGDHAPPVAQGLVADGVDAAMDADQPPGRHPPVDLAAGVPERDQLRATDNPALTSGEPGLDNVAFRPVDRPGATFATYTVENVT